MDVNAWESYFRVFPLSHFFYEFRNKCAESEAFPNDAIADTELRKDIYHFSSNIACSVSFGRRTRFFSARVRDDYTLIVFNSTTKRRTVSLSVVIRTLSDGLI